MNYLQRIKCHFYSEELKRSDMQLTQDFGEFPPYPLNCNGLDCEFIIVRIRGAGGLYANLQLFKRILQVKRADEVASSLHGVLQVIQGARTQITDALLGLRNLTLTNGQRIVFALVLFPFLLLAGLLITPWAIFNAVKLLTSFYRHIPGGVGYFIPLFINETRIVIKADALEKRNDGESILAHEHIHFLQHSNGLHDSKQSNCRDILIEEACRDDAQLLYLLQKNETEARLHEIVLSHYRIQKSLPLTLRAFITMLAGSKCFGALVIEAMETDGVAIEKDVVQYYERSEAIAHDIGWILASIKNLDLRRRFIYEVLTVMYANLIRCYGDETSNQLFLKEVSRPNLYDALYGD